MTLHNQKGFCPHCGYDLRPDTPVFINNFTMFGPASQLMYDQTIVKLTESERFVCWTLLKAYPEAVTQEVILDRMGSDAMGNVINVYVCRIRKKLREIGAPNPIEPTYNKAGRRAYRWKP